MQVMFFKCTRDNFTRRNNSDNNEIAEVSSKVLLKIAIGLKEVVEIQFGSNTCTFQ